MLLLSLLACAPGAPTCADRLEVAADVVRERWPNAEAALALGFGEGCVWGWSHGRESVDGFGATMVLLSEEPGIDDVFDLDLDVYAGGRLESPSLLFFDQGAGRIDTWPLIGVGYHFDYEPCARPEAPCFTDDVFFVHEAGYHHVIVGGGGMSLATDEDLVDGSVASVDTAGCSDVDDDDLRPRFNTVKHGRAWDLHLWFPSAGGVPTVSVYDPEARWRDAVSAVTIDSRSFFVPDDDECGCTPRSDTGDTAVAAPPTCGTVVAPPNHSGGCGGRNGAWLLPGMALLMRKRR